MKVSELSGVALDFWVAKADGRFRDQLAGYFGIERDCEIDVAMFGWMEGRRPDPFKPSTNWAQGGPIIERERIDVVDYDGSMWIAMFPDLKKRRHTNSAYGRTPLIAAMRCLVASKFGEEVNDPLDQKLADRLVRDFGKPTFKKWPPHKATTTDHGPEVSLEQYHSTFDAGDNSKTAMIVATAGDNFSRGDAVTTERWPNGALLVVRYTAGRGQPCGVAKERIEKNERVLFDPATGAVTTAK